MATPIPPVLTAVPKDAPAVAAPGLPTLVELLDPLPDTGLFPPETLTAPIGEETEAVPGAELVE